MNSYLVLHQYAISPFSEKIRLMLGYCNASWLSVETPVAPPRPSLDSVWQGYRRIPVMQQGRHYYCDSRLIAELLAQQFNKPELSYHQLSQQQQKFCDQLEQQVFIACMADLPIFPWLRAVYRSIPGPGFWPALWDRIQLIRKHPEMKISKSSARQQWQQHLQHLDNTLQHSVYLAGNQNPNLCDFSAYHLLWFRQQISGKTSAENYPSIQAWFTRLSGLGHGRKREISASTAVQQARLSALPLMPQQCSADNRTATIRATDYLCQPTKGRLVEESEISWTLQQSAGNMGEILISFPKTGFDLSPDQPL